jgi:hypothetical protein
MDDALQVHLDPSEAEKTAAVVCSLIAIVSTAATKDQYWVRRK